jgi:hypothetical protein
MSDNEILEHVTRSFPIYDILYKFNNQPLMIIQIMTKTNLPFFMHRANTVGYMGIHFAPLAEITHNPIISLSSRPDKHHGIHFEFNGQHDYFAQLYDSSPLQYLFEGDTKPAKCI